MVCPTGLVKGRAETTGPSATKPVCMMGSDATTTVAGGTSTGAPVSESSKTIPLRSGGSNLR